MTCRNRYDSERNRHETLILERSDLSKCIKSVLITILRTMIPTFHLRNEMGRLLNRLQ